MFSIKQFFWKFWYRYLSGRIGREPVTFLNYGYWPGETLPLEAADEPNRPAIQLYHRIAGQMDLKGLSVLEVSCGHGGGASFLMRYHRPKSYTAVDQNSRAISFDLETHGSLGIDFRVGDAQALEFPGNSFDAVLNVEASHCYPRQLDFFRSANRVLKPGGSFLFADFRTPREVPVLEGDFSTAGFTAISKADITPEVLNALKRTSGKYRDLVRKFTPKFLHPATDAFAAVEGSPIYNRFAEGKFLYLVYRLVKN